MNFGNVHVGAAATQALSITNTALADGFSEKLDASLGGATGNATASGSFTLLGPTATNNSSLVVGIDTSSAGHKSGTGSITLTSDGTGTSGLGNTALSSQTVNVSGSVYNLASSSTIGAIDFGLRHVGDGPITRLLTITNTAPGGAFSEGLDSSFGAFSGTGGSRISTSGSITNLIAGATDSSSMSITLDTSTVGNVNGTQAVHQASNGTISGLGNTALADQNPQVTGQVANGMVVRFANPQINNAPIDFGNVRIGTVLTPQAISVTNNVPNDGFSESLIGNVVGTSNSQVTASGGFGPPSPNPELAPSATDNTHITASIDTSSGGAKSGNAIINFKSDGTGFSGGTITDLGNTNVAVQGNVYRLANPTLNTSSVALAARVGDASPSAAVSVTNTSPDAFTEGLKASLGTAPSGFSSSGSIGNLAAGGTNSSSLRVGLNTATSGTFSGSVGVNFTSTGAGTDNAPDLALTGGSVGVSARSIRPPWHRFRPVPLTLASSMSATSLQPGRLRSATPHRAL